MSANYFYVSWEQFQEDTLKLKTYLVNRSFKGLVAITRGGLVPAAILSHALGIRFIETICLASYADSTKQQGQLQIIKALEDNSDQLIIVDDLVDTGATMTHVSQLLPHALRITVYAKPHGEHAIHHFAHNVAQDTWIVFPWEIPS
jgi:xanthine phosphoribosyltransferase